MGGFTFELWGVYIAINFLPCFVSILMVYSSYVRWIKKLGKDTRGYDGRFLCDSLDKMFPSWKGTKKPYMYFAFWNITSFLHIAIGLTIFLLTYNLDFVAFAAFGYMILFWSLHAIIHVSLKKREENKY